MTPPLGRAQARSGLRCPPPAAILRPPDGRRCRADYRRARGLTGMLLAVACAGAGLQVAIVDPQHPAAMLAAGFDGRTSAIAYGSRLVFDGIGLWPQIAAEAEPIREIRVADDESPLFLHYDHRDLDPKGTGGTPLGYIVENRVLRRALLRARPRAAESATPRAARHRRGGGKRDRRNGAPRRWRAAAHAAGRRRRRQGFATAPAPPRIRADRMALPHDRRPASSRRLRMPGRMAASRSSISCRPARSRYCR